MAENPINWHELDRDSFMYWALLMLASESRVSGGQDQFDEIQKATNKFKEINLTMQLSGVEVNGVKLLERLYEMFNKEVNNTAGEMVKEQLDRIWRLSEKFAETMDRAADSVLDAVKAEGIEIRRDDW